MSILDVFRKPSKYEGRLDEAIDILSDICKAIKDYSKEDDLLESYHYLRKDIYNINLARLELENSLLRNNLSRDEDYEELCYEHKYKLSTVKSEMETSIIEALSAINLLIKNYKKLYKNCDKQTQKRLIEGYNNCLKYLNKAKKILLDKDSVSRYITDREGKLQEEIEIKLRNEYNIKVDNSVNGLILKLDKCNSGILSDLSQMVTLVGERKIENVSMILKKLSKRVEFIEIVINVIKNKNSIENKNDIMKNLNFIENENNEIKFNIDLIRYNSKKILMDIQLNNPIDADDFKEAIDKVKENCEEIKENIFKINSKLKENYHKDKNECLNIEDRKYNAFCIDSYIRYYYYDKEDIEREWDNYEEIINGIDEMGAFEQDGYCFRYTKNGMILGIKTKEDVMFEFLDNCKDVRINGKKKYLNLNKRFEVDKLMNYTRITTTVTELNDYIMCVFYIDNTNAYIFVRELEKVKSIQENKRKDI
ncbi:hypothetical protein PMY38_02245 [Clostridium tertium]|uniref:hypothetical protein n=1 Tax=Clostridium TaxID=1485 RepID=UPI00028893B4|nr:MULTISPECIES: hypothetical protein [Clostridium]MDU8965766.1 hypothetical protein [Clostridium sp.]EEH98294.2 hypothetical protein CSBG_01920 [Clostridium sp. 7_2_43FAA]MDB1947223.1 hypothetical protein [Clostridium tertium]MDB1954033.1 hypothetical protein [Clostridium tertium]MDB1957407.1 hypothetical protein [Clostridium tertium]